MDEYSTKGQVETVVLDRVRILAGARISRFQLQDAEVRVLEYTADTILAQFEARLAARKWTTESDCGEVVSRHPSTWWDAVKDRFLRRWTHVQYTTVCQRRMVQHTYHVCPHVGAGRAPTGESTLCLPWLADPRERPDDALCDPVVLAAEKVLFEPSFTHEAIAARRALEDAIRDYRQRLRDLPPVVAGKEDR